MRWRIFAITWLATIGFYLTRKSFAVAKVDLSGESISALSDEQMAWIDGAFLLAYAGGQFIWGLPGDRVGARRVVLPGLLVSALVPIAMGFSTGVVWLIAFSLVQGLSQATNWAPLLKNLGNFFTRAQRGRVVGWWSTNHVVGGLCGSLLAGIAAQTYGWRSAFFVPAAALLVITFLFWRFQRDTPEQFGLPALPEEKVEESVAPAADSWAGLFRVLGQPMVLLLCVVYFCLKPARYAILFWGPKLLNDKLGSSVGESAALSSMFELAGLVGIVAAGYVSDKVFGARRMPVAVLSLLGLGALLFCFDGLPPSRWILGSALLAMGFLTYAADTVVSAVAPVDFGCTQGASTASGWVNGMGSLGAIAGGTIPGLLKREWGWGGVFIALASAVSLAGLLLLPKWNAVPAANGNSPKA